MTTTRAPALCPADADLLAAARLRAARCQPYLASALFGLVPVSAPDLGTFAVDRWWRVYIDMEAARAWGVAATAAVLVHEAHHLIRDHHGRAARLPVPTRHSHLWNLAGDAAINDDLVADELPLPDPVLPHHLGLAPHGFEEAYLRQLIASASVDEQRACGSGAGGLQLPVEHDEAPERSGVDGVDEIDAAAIRRAVAQDVVLAQDHGRPVSPGLARWARDLLNPQVPWRHLLRTSLGRSVREVSATPYPDWTQLDRRADLQPDILRPGHRHHRPEIAVVLDTSASMSQTLLDAAVTELNSLLHRAGIREVIAITCDATTTRPQRLRRLGDLCLTGGGGTDLRVGIASAGALRPRPSIIAVLTDGWTPWPAAAPTRTTLVAIVIGPDAPLPTGPGITAIRIDQPT